MGGEGRARGGRVEVGGEGRVRGRRGEGEWRARGGRGGGEGTARGRRTCMRTRVHAYKRTRVRA